MKTSKKRRKQMVFLSSYNKLIENDFTICYGDKGIVVTKEKHAFYLDDDQIAYAMNADGIDPKDILKELAARDDLPEDLREFVETRTAGPVGREIEMFADSDGLSTFCDDKDFAKYYGIDDPVEVSLKVVDSFSTQKDFDESFEKDRDGELAYGFWDVERDRMSCSFMYGHPIQTKMCFGDFGTSELKRGSLFVKMEISRK